MSTIYQNTPPFTGGMGCFDRGGGVWVGVSSPLYVQNGRERPLGFLLAQLNANWVRECPPTRCELLVQEFVQLLEVDTENRTNPMCGGPCDSEIAIFRPHDVVELGQRVIAGISCALL